MAIVPTLEMIPDQLRSWGIRSGISILDQGLTSGAGFLLNLFLARWLASDAYGAFAVTFATLLFLAGFHNVLLLEPMSVFGPSSYVGQMPGYFIGQIKVHVALVGGLSVVMLLAAAVMAGMGMTQELVLATAGSALALPFLFLLWLVRRMCYVVHRPSAAVWGSTGYLCLMLAGIFVLHFACWLNAFSAFLLMGIASVPAALLLLWRLGVMDADTSSVCPWKHVLRENWNYGRWLVGSTTLYSAANQTQTYLTAAFLGLGAAGIVRAMQIPSLIMTQIIIAVGLLVLPTMSSDFGLGRISQLRRKAVLCTIFLTALALAFALILGLFAKPLESLLFGGKFSTAAWLIPILALVPVCTGFTTGFSMAVRAYQQPRLDLLTNAISAPVGLATSVLLIKIWGLAGAGVSLVAGSAAYGVAFFWMFVRMGSRNNGAGDGVARVESPI
jgi:O-antigen/teichoic acid export membrane protein